MRNLLFVIMLFCVAGVSLGVSIGGSLEIDKCSIKAGKPATEEDPNDFKDQVQFLGLMDATEQDLLNVLDVNDILVSLDCNDLLSPLEWTFPVNDEAYKNGKYNYARTENASQSFFEYYPANGKILFSAKNVDLTGLSCPITVTVAIGDYSAHIEVDEDIVNGSKPCPPELMMGVRNTLTVDKFKAKLSNVKINKDSFLAKGRFSVATDPNTIYPMIVELGDQSFTVGGDNFTWNKSETILKCNKAVPIEDSDSLVSAFFNFSKGRYKLQIKNATIDNPSDPNGVVDFSIDCLGNELPAQPVEVPRLNSIGDHVHEIEMSMTYDYGWGKTLDANSVPESYQFDAWMRVDDTVVSGTVKTPEGAVYPAKWEGSDDDDANDVSTEWLGVDAWETTLEGEGLSDFTEGVYIFTVTYENGKSESTPILYALEDGSPIPDVNEPPIIVYPVHDANNVPLNPIVELNPNGLSNPVWTYGIEWFPEEDEDEDSAAGSGWLDDLPYNTVSIQLSDLLPNTLYEIELTADYAISSTNVDGIPYVIDKDSEAEIQFTTATSP